MTMIRYSTEATVTVDEFIDLLERSTLGARRPVADRECMTATCWSVSPAR